jgi:hypothetical protein
VKAITVLFLQTQMCNISFGEQVMSMLRNSSKYEFQEFKECLNLKEFKESKKPKKIKERSGSNIWNIVDVGDATRGARYGILHFKAQRNY